MGEGTDNEIRFGDLEKSSPRTELRPDQNRHYAVVAYESPTEQDLAVFIDVDVVREVEAHAVSDTRVELGGVLLGGQFQDETGRPFVLITDSLRAQHYENTKGSFKFTHETWSTITRQRNEFPPDLQMVGWYHTHPDWGVFLSGMDNFICDHFFNGPLDVALVIDPCRMDRAFFQWPLQAPFQSPLQTPLQTPGQPPDQTRQSDSAQTGPQRTGGFYLVGSRFRLPEMEIYVAQLEGRTTMPSDPRFSTLASGYPMPAGQLNDARSIWLPLAILGSLTMQFLLVALIAWRVFLPTEADGVDQRALERKELAGERAMLNRIAGEVKVAPDSLVSVLEEQTAKNDELRSSNVGLLARVRELQRSVDTATRKQQALESDANRLRDAVTRSAKQKAEQRDEIKTLKAKITAFAPSADGDDSGETSEATLTLWDRARQWKWYLGGALILAIAVILTVVAYQNSESEHEDNSDELDSDEPNEGNRED